MGGLTPPRNDADEVPATVKDLIERQLRCLVLETPFPCLGSRAALRNDSYIFNVYPDLRTPESLRGVAADLRYFAQVRRRLMGDFYTYIVSFLEPRLIGTEEEWEGIVWRSLQELHDTDDEPWDPRWSTDPADANFALSLAGLGQLVVTLYPGASRYARRFAWPTLIFNPLEQDRANFPEEDEFLRFQDKIRERDARLQGNVNPSLPATLDDPQAPGFSGAPIDEGWQCPLVVRRERSRRLAQPRDPQ